MVSSYATEEHLSTISIATSSGITKFVLIKNYKEMSQVLSELISKKQKNIYCLALIWGKCNEYFRKKQKVHGLFGVC